MRRGYVVVVVFSFWDFSDRCRSYSLSSFSVWNDSSLSLSLSLMRMLRVFESIDLLATLQLMRGSSHLAVGTAIAGTAPIDTALQLAIHHELVLVYQEFPLLLARAGKVR